MPRVSETVLRSVAFLCPRPEEAEAHSKVGGTCFLIGHQIIVDEIPQPAFVPYMVTAQHVLRNAGSTAIRINRKDGGRPDIIELECHDWIPHPGGADLAIAPMSECIDQAIHDITYIQTHDFVTKEKIDKHKIGPGDEVFISDRLNHQGKEDDTAALRSGNISTVLETIWNEATQRDEESFALEMRSRTESSGAPVVAYRTPATILSTDIASRCFFCLLGVNWGYVFDKETGENSWLNGIVPAWKIIETLEVPMLRENQQAGIEEWMQAHLPKRGPLSVLNGTRTQSPSEAPPHVNPQRAAASAPSAAARERRLYPRFGLPD